MNNGCASRVRVGVDTRVGPWRPTRMSRDQIFLGVAAEINEAGVGVGAVEAVLG